MAAGPAVAEEACPADLPVVLAQQPARLASCRAEDRRSRVFAAQALAKIGRRAEAADRYRALAEEWPALAEVFALRAAEQSPEPSVPAPTGRRWLDSARTRLSVEASVGMDGPLLEAAAKAATDLGLDGAGLHLMLLRAAVRLRDEAAVLRELRVLRLRYAGGAEEREALAVCGDRLPVTSLEDDELARRWNGWTARAGAGEVAAECRPLATRRSRLAGAALLACGRALATVRSEAAAGLLERAAASKDVEADALLALARVRARGTDDGVVVRACARLAKVRRSASQKADCDYLAAFQTLQHGRRGEGRRRLEAVVHDHRRTPRASDAAWLLAFDDWTYDKAAAFERFDAMVRSTKDADDKAQALYWRGRARSDREAARGDWREARRLDPLGYYGLLAATRLGERRGPESPPPASAEAPFEAPVDPVTAFARLLLEAGLVREAGWELAERLSARRADPAAWAPLLAAAGRFDLLMNIGQAHGGHGGGWPAESLARRAAVQAAFPLAYPDLVSASSTGGDPQFLRALMRRESRFDPNAASAAEARGLLQLLPATAARVADLLHLEAPAPEALFDPGTNVRLASGYVARLTERFRHPFVVAAAYNAGPKAVAGWLADRAGMPVDEWVERIPFRETRAYVKAVGGAWGAYGLVWNDGRPDVALGPVPEAGDGVDF